MKPVPQKTAVPVVSNMRERVLELAIPVIGEAIGKYPDHPKAELAAAETLKAFHGQGISALTATKALTREDFWSIIQETGLKGRDDLWFNTYYDCLEQKALSKSSGSNGPGATA